MLGTGVVGKDCTRELGVEEEAEEDEEGAPAIIIISELTSSESWSSLSSLSSLSWESSMATNLASLRAVATCMGRTESLKGDRGVTFSQERATYCRVMPLSTAWPSWSLGLGGGVWGESVLVLVYRPKSCICKKVQAS